MKDRPHWSYSSLNQYMRCPLQFYFERILTLPKPTVSSDLILGSAVHYALAEYHLRLKHAEPIKPVEIHEAFLDCWTVKEIQEKVEYRGKNSRNESIEKGIALLDLYLKEEPPRDIVAVEHRTLVPIRNSLGFCLETPLIAVADLISRDAGFLKITELKTSGRAYGESEIETSMQATCYVNAVWETFEECATVEFAVLVKTKTPKLQRLSTARTEGDLGRLGDLVENVERAVKAEIFYPVETPLNCSNCPYRQPCRDWKPTGKNNVESNLVQLNGVAEC